jgi:hypothetical protein
VAAPIIRSVRKVPLTDQDWRQNGGTARYPDVVLPMRSVSVLSGSALALRGLRQLNSAAAALHGEAELTLFSDGRGPWRWLAADRAGPRLLRG